MTAPRGLDADLVARAQGGDEAARSRLLTALGPVLRSFFLRRLGARAEIDDLVQNTLLRVHNGLSDLKDPSRVRAFALKAALYELQDLYRGRYRAKEHLYDPENPPVSPGTDRAPGEGMDLARALATLTPRARQIVELREYGYHYEEIAEMIGSTEAAIKMQVKRAFERMRDVLVGLFLLVQGFSG